MSGASGTASERLVPPLHPFDTGALARFLRDAGVAGTGPLGVLQFQGGQSNPTYRVNSGTRSMVLRRKPPGTLLPSAHAVDREFRVMKALAATGVPVPRMIALCEDPAVIGTPFYLMEHVEGRVLWDPALPGMSPAERGAHYDELNRVIAALHAVDYAAVGLGDYGRIGGFVLRQIERWSRQYESGGAARIASMDRVIEWLPRHLPADEETAIVHGDFRIDNVIFHPTEPRILAVLDWELSTLGHPLSDFAYHVMAWRLKAGEFRGLADCDFAALGIPDEARYVAEYCRRTSRSRIADWDFYLIFNMFRITAILHGVMSRALQGNAASGNALETGARAARIADVAWEMAQRIDHGES